MDWSKINISSYIPAMPYKVRELVDKATNIVMNYTETEAKVVEATNDEAWGPAGKLLQELAQLTYSYEHYNEVIPRFFLQGENSRRLRRLGNGDVVEAMFWTREEILATNVQSKIFPRPFSFERLFSFSRCSF